MVLESFNNTDLKIYKWLLSDLMSDAFVTRDRTYNTRGCSHFETENPKTRRDGTNKKSNPCRANQI